MSHEEYSRGKPPTACVTPPFSTWKHLFAHPLGKISLFSFLLFKDKVLLAM